MRIMITIALALAVLGCQKDNDAKPTVGAERAAPAEANRISIAVTEKGFDPEDVRVPAGKPVTLVFDRTTDKTCAKEVVIRMADGSKIERSLPLNTPVEVATTFPTAGRVSYACGMDMVRGTITVQ